jgi:hypothetical protein
VLVAVLVLVLAAVLVLVLVLARWTTWWPLTLTFMIGPPCPLHQMELLQQPPRGPAFLPAFMRRIVSLSTKSLASPVWPTPTTTVAL